ncbi:hypothetical protein [Flagellimonas flava]
MEQLNYEQKKALEEGFCPHCFHGISNSEKEVQHCKNCRESWDDEEFEEW